MKLDNKDTKELQQIYRKNELKPKLTIFKKPKQDKLAEIYK